MTERWLRRIRAHLDTLEPPHDLWERARDQETREDSARPSSGQRLAAAVVGLLIVAALVVGGWILLRSDGGVSPAEVGPQEEARARVICGERTQVVTSSVVRGPDGVHFEVRNPAGAAALLVLHRDDQTEWLRRGLAEKDSARFTLPTPPGKVLVACLHPPVNLFELRDDDFASFTIAAENPPQPGAPGDLWYRTFFSTAVTEAGDPRPLVPATRIEVTFFEKRGGQGAVGWHAGCNFFGAEVEISDDHLLVGEVGGTEQGCLPETLHEQDEWLAEFFRSNPSWELRGRRLTLTSGATVIELLKSQHELRIPPGVP